MHLLHLALADEVGRAADPAAGERRFERGGQVEGVGEEVVAQQDGRLVAPLGVDRRGVAADHGLVEDVVVDERGRVDHLDDRRQHRVRRGQARRTPGRSSSTSAGRSRLPRKSAQWSTSCWTNANRLPSSAAKIRSASASSAAIGA